MTETAADRLAAIRARHKAATEGPWEHYPDYGPTFFANTSGPYLQGVGDFNFGQGEQAEADEALVSNAQQDISWLLAYADGAIQAGRKQQEYIEELKGVIANARKLVSAWLRTSGQHFSVSNIDAVKDNPFMAGMQEGSANQYSDCANELKDVLDGEDPDTGEYDNATQTTPAEASHG